MWLAKVLRRSLKFKLFVISHDLLQFLRCFGLIGHLAGELWPLVMLENGGNSCLGKVQMAILLRIGTKLSSAVPKAAMLPWRGESSRPEDVQLKCFWICADRNASYSPIGIWDLGWGVYILRSSWFLGIKEHYYYFL